MSTRGFEGWCENVAIQLRRELGLTPTDPLDPKALAKHLGIEVWAAEEVPGLHPNYLAVLLREDPVGWSAVTVSVETVDVIIFNSALPRERRVSDLAHELAHILIRHEPGRLDVTEDGLFMLSTHNRKQENEATWLAGTLLLPRPALIRIGWEGMELRTAAKQYGVSVEMLRYRLNRTDVNEAFKVMPKNVQLRLAMDRSSSAYEGDTRRKR
ncbi:MAG TPA: ImmA/IrrE family metallo-endopeptidase [Nitrospiraceae bacterium]|nr:ImmA/IrrE family metallo-endopeptidase [Nitrospiraceae bacterium]